jgi:hypothetical protein
MPSSKQSQKSNQRKVRSFILENLSIVIWNLFGIWRLVFGIPISK